MTPADRQSSRVLILAPIGRDGPATAEILKRVDLQAAICPDLAGLCREVLAGAAAVFVAEEDGVVLAWGHARVNRQLEVARYAELVGLVVTMLHSRGAFARIRVLAPLGRMALTNYLTQSVVCALVFYHFGLGQWGMPRAQQVLFVVVVYAAQVGFSHWWLARFNYGPMEWLWRGFTYREVPRLRIDKAAGAAVVPAA